MSGRPRGLRGVARGELRRRRRSSVIEHERLVDGRAAAASGGLPGRLRPRGALRRRGRVFPCAAAARLQVVAEVEADRGERVLEPLDERVADVGAALLHQLREDRVRVAERGLPRLERRLEVVELLLERVALVLPLVLVVLLLLVGDVLRALLGGGELVVGGLLLGVALLLELRDLF